MKKLIRYRIPISRTFPKGHKRAGKETYFINAIENALNDKEVYVQCGFKLHTIRANYPLWEKRFKKIMAGEAVLELYYWSGKPRRSKQIVICQLSKDDGIGLQKIQRDLFWYIDNLLTNYFTDKIAKNDGLSYEDFNEWFKNYDLSKPMAIIHFTKFRY